MFVVVWYLWFNKVRDRRGGRCGVLRCGDDAFSRDDLFLFIFWSLESIDRRPMSE